MNILQLLNSWNEWLVAVEAADNADIFLFSFLWLLEPRCWEGEREFEMNKLFLVIFFSVSIDGEISDKWMGTNSKITSVESTSEIIRGCHEWDYPRSRYLCVYLACISYWSFFSVANNKHLGRDVFRIFKASNFRIKWRVKSEHRNEMQTHIWDV